MRKNPRSKKPSFKLKPMCAAVLLAFSVSATANPNGGAVVNGSASFNTNGNTLTVTNTPGTIINWQGFSINSNEITHFAQQSASSAVLNRVITSNPSVILGTLSSNGRVFLVNPGGIVFGAGSTVDVAGMVATSLNLSDADFLAGRGNFTLTPGAQAVSNAGNITAQQGGEIYLIAPNVENSGIITAPNGEILLAAGHEVQLVNTLDPNLRINITAPAGDATNVGQLVASAGRLGLFGTVVKNTGTVSADSATMQGGKIVFKASQRVELGGTVSANGVSGGSVSATAAHSADANTPGVVVQTGTIDAQGASGLGGSVQVNADNVLSSAAINVNGATAGGQIGVQASVRAITTATANYSANATQGQGGDILVSAGVSNYTSGSYNATGNVGGNITVAGNEIKLAGAQLDAGGTNGGGNIHIGGLMHGAAGFSAQGIALGNATNVLSNSSTSIKANALQNGNGGEVVLWSDQSMIFKGVIAAKGGALSGNGGNAEVSGLQSLGYGGLTNLSASNGLSGTLLLDPRNITIVAGVGALPNVTGPSLLEFLDPTPGASEGFGGNPNISNWMTELANGNLVLISQNDSTGAANAGAVYVYSPTGTLVSALIGSGVNDNVGSGGITQLSVNGNFVINSDNWGAGVANASPLGAVTWGSGTAGVSGIVGSSNSIVGATANDQIGRGYSGSPVVALSNGNYAVASAFWNGGVGAVTWVDGATGRVSDYAANANTNVISLANSQTGFVAGDYLGSKVIALPSNGNYVISGGYNAASISAWVNGTNGQTRDASNVLSATNSLIGSGSPYALTNGNYVVVNGFYEAGVAYSNRGVATWMNGTTGLASDSTLVISIFNSIIGQTNNDLVGQNGIVALSNGNYVIANFGWSSNTGAVTWVNGSTGATSNGSNIVSQANSVVGNSTSEQVGARVVALTNGNYVIGSYNWRGPEASYRTSTGAVTWVNGSTGLTVNGQGQISQNNSLLGFNTNDQVGFNITALSNGNYVVGSPFWGGNKGAVTWGDGLGGTVTSSVGFVDATNSLVGSVASDYVGATSYLGGNNITALSNGNYVVGSNYWNGYSGAVTWGNGATAGLRTKGTISSSNSIVGATVQYLGYATLLANGNYVVGNASWNAGRGAATWVDGTTGQVSDYAANANTNIVSATNSLVGSALNDNVGLVNALSNGNYVVTSANWDNAGVANVGAATWVSGATGQVANYAANGNTNIISAANSLVGSSANDQVGLAGIIELGNNNYAVKSVVWNNGTTLEAGAVTWSAADGSTVGVVSASNSLLGTQSIEQLGYEVFALQQGANLGKVFVGSPNANKNGLVGAGRAYIIGAPTTSPGTSSYFNDTPSADISVGADYLSSTLNLGTNVVLQANNNITQNVGAAVTATGAGSLIFQAGHSIILNDSISIVGSLVLIANDANANLAHRSLGVALIDASGATLSGGAMAFTNTGGSILLNNVTATGTTGINAAGGTILSGTNSFTSLSVPSYSHVISIASGTTTFSDGLGNVGFLNVDLGATLNLNGVSATTIGTVTLSGGAISSANGLDVGNLNWHGGTLTGTGLLSTNSFAVIDGSAVLLDKSWNNNGVANFIGVGELLLDGNGTTLVVFTNDGSVNFNGSSATPIASATSAVNKSFVNNGSLQKNSGSAATQNIALGSVTNTTVGLINVKSGTLSINSGTAASLTQAGTIIVDAGTTFRAGSFTNAAATGQLMGKGTFDMNGGTLTNNGAILPAAWETGTLTIAGDLVMGATGTLLLNVNGTVAGQYDVLNVSGTADVTAGTLELTGVGAAANTYNVLNATVGLTGPFTAINPSTFTQGTHIYGANALTLDLTANAVTGYITWDGGAGTTNWNDAANWSLDYVPTATDSLYVGISGFDLPANINVANYYQSGEAGQFYLMGDLTVHATNDITFAGVGGGFISPSYSTNSLILLADNNISMSAATITAGLNSQLNVVLNSDADGSGLGSIMLTDSSITTNGGDITLGGGVAGNGTGWARGTVDDGISLTNSTLDAGTGNIALNGRGMDGTSFAYGVGLYTNSLLTTTGGGAITINGVGGAGVAENRGVSIGGGSDVTTLNGDIFINGYGGLSTGSLNYGVTIEGAGSVDLLGSTVKSTGTGTVNIEAHGGSVGSAGITNRAFVLRNGGGVYSNSGSINVIGYGGYDGNGIRVGTSISDVATIISAGGDINLFGITGDGFTSDRGVQLQGSGVQVQTSGNINISGTSIASGIGGSHNGVRIQDGATVDTSSVGGTNLGSINILAQGGNRGDGFQLLGGSSLRTDFGNITIVAQSGGNQADSTQLVGAAISASIISSKRGNIFIDGTSKASFGSYNYGVMVTDASAISTLLTGNVTLIGQGGNGADGATILNTVLNNGVGVNGNSSVSVVHGLISMFGTAGTITGNTNRGVEIHGATTLVRATGTGSIYINGVLPGSSTGFDSGVVVGFGADVATTSGAINITGSGVNGGSNNYGVRVEDDGSTITSTSGNITLTGSGSTTGTANYGVGITNAIAAAAGSMVSSGTGNLKIVSKAGDVLLSGASTTVGVIASPTVGGTTTLSSQRDIIVDSALTLSSTPVTLRVDNTGTGVGVLSFTGTGHITTGTVNIYYNPITFGVQESFTANISADFTNLWMLVNNAANLQAMGSSVLHPDLITTNLQGNYALGNNLDMTGFVGFTPIGSNATPFTGNFDGLNREISNLTINTPGVSQVGLFGVIGATTGAVKNLGLTNVFIRGDASVGALAGINYGSIYNTYVSGGTVTGSNGATGGLVGVNQGGNGTNAVGVSAAVAGSMATISNSYVEKVNVAVMAAISPAAGGMVGINRAGNGGNGGNGAVAAIGAIGGAGGSASVTNSYVTGGTVSGMGSMAGQYVGGMIGQNIGGNGGNGGVGNAASAAGGAGGAGGAASLSNSYSSSGAVSGSNGQRGGLIGNNLLGNAGTPPVGFYDGAAGGVGVTSATNLFWNTTSTFDSSATGIGTNTGTLTNVLGTTDAGMRSGFIGLDFTNTWWLSTPSNTLPMLRSEWNTEINNAHQLQLMDVNLGANYTLGRDLNLASALTVSTGSVWMASGLISVGTTYAGMFNGTFDGQGFTLTNLRSDGLFGAIGPWGVVNNANLISATGGSGVAATNQGLIINSSVANSIISRDFDAGALVGINNGWIVNSTASNTVVQMATATSGNGINIGGLVGSNNGFLMNSHVVSGSVSGLQSIGGLVGRNNGLVSNSYVTGNAVSQSFATSTSRNDFGGLVGFNDLGTISNSYVSGGSVAGDSRAAGLVGSNGGRILNSYISTGTITSAGWVGPMVAYDYGYLLNSHYDIDAVLVSVDGVPANKKSMVMSGGLYNFDGAGQFRVWKDKGTLNMDSYSLPGGSLAQTGNIHTINSIYGLQDLLGFAADPRYNYQLAFALNTYNMVTLENYSVPVFAGALNGNGNTLNNLSINTPSAGNVGLFGGVLAYATIDSLLLANPTVAGSSTVGALAGWNQGVILNSGVTGGFVSAAGTVGGLVGVNDGVIIQSYVSGGSVSASASATTSGMNFGGLVGVNNGSIISNSFVSNGTISDIPLNGISHVGGLVGGNWGKISNASVNGLVMNNMTLATDVGGLVGRNEAGASLTYSSVKNVAGTADVTGRDNVGGLVGQNIRGNSRGVTRIGIVDNNYFSGTSVAGQNYVGGLVGLDNYATGDGTYIGVTNNYVSSGAVSGTTSLGALVGNGLPRTATNNHYEIASVIGGVTLSGVSVNGKTVVMEGGLYATQFADWVGSGDLATGGLALNIATYSDTGGPLEMIGGKYTITSTDGLKALLGFADNAAYSFALGNDIDLTGTDNYSIPVLAGTFDGQGHTISGVNINMQEFDNVGFIQLLADGTVSNLGLIAPTVVGRYNVGGLVGISGLPGQMAVCSGTCVAPRASIVNSYISGGTVTGDLGSIGGLVGGNQSGATIENSYVANTNVTSAATGSPGTAPNPFVGGLVGTNEGTISNSFVSGGTVIASISDGFGSVGGLVGANYGNISTSYASGGTVDGMGVYEIGGLVGANYGSIDQSYAAETALSYYGAGALVGLNETGASISNSFWDTTVFFAPGTYSANGTETNVVGVADITLFASVSPVLFGVTDVGGTSGNTWRIYDGLSGPVLLGFLKPMTVSVAGSRIYNGSTDVGGLASFSTPRDANVLGTLLADTSSQNVGAYSVTPSGGLFSDQLGYDISYTSGTVNITPAALTLLGLKANNGVKTYGTTYSFGATDFTVANGALLGADSIVGMTFTSAGAVDTANVGSYAITPSNATFAAQGSELNYNITYVNGTLTVNPAPLTVTAIVQTKIYGEADPALTYTSVGLLFSDVLGGSLGRGAGQNVGNYAINQGSLNNPNYAITFTGNTLSITPRDITVTSLAASKVYGDADPNLFTVAGSSLASWDTNATAFTGSLSHVAGENVGTYSITRGSLASNSNYNVSAYNISGLLTITPAPLTVVANSLNKVLGTPDPLLTYMTYGLKLNDTAATTLSGELDRDIGDTVGTYSINQGNLTLLSSNYTMTYQAGTFRILAPTVVQEITQMSLQSAPAEDTATTSEEEEKKESAELVAEAAIVDDSGQSLAEPLPVCR